MHFQVIIGSVRMGRIGPQIARWMQDIVSSSDLHSCEVLDLIDWPLPMDDEPHLPATGQYIQPHTQAWSQKIAEGDAYIFLFPQYNWGYPAALKNAIDHLYHEWKGKPAILVSYANRGGGKAAVQLRQVLIGIDMIPLETALEIKLSDVEFLDDGQIASCEESLKKYTPQLIAAIKESIVAT